MSANVEIEYCVPCGHLDRALDTQRAILEHFGQGFDLNQIVGGIEQRS